MRHKRVATKTAEELHTLVSSLMQQTHLQHVEDKKKDLINTLKHRELIYVDASKKWDMDLFSYMTRCYFNACSEEVRREYNRMGYSHEPELFDWQPGSDDWYFDKKVFLYKSRPEWQQEGSDSMISFWALKTDIGMLMLLNDQQDFNIFLDNVDSVTPMEKGIINSAIRGWLLVSANQWIGLYINNTKNTWNSALGTGNHPPEDMHDMRVEYI